MERAQTERSRLALILPGLLLGMLLAALDQTIVGTAMPRVIAELQGLEHYAWVFTAYMLTSTVTVPLYGKLSDLYGRRTFFLFGMIVFLIGSALSGMAQSMTQLIFFRALQGIGGGALFPIAIAIVGDLFPPAERGKWQGLFAAVFGFSAIIGPSLGGWITDNWGWRWVFYVNMPVGALALLTTGLTMPKLASGRQHRIDYLGAALLVSGVTPLLRAFSWAGTEYPWSSPPIIGLFGASALFLVLFVAAELRAPEPILDLRLFGNRIFTPHFAGCLPHRHRDVRDDPVPPAVRASGARPHGDQFRRSFDPDDARVRLFQHRRWPDPLAHWTIQNPRHRHRCRRGHRYVFALPDGRHDDQYDRRP